MYIYTQNAYIGVTDILLLISLWAKCYYFFYAPSLENTNTSYTDA